jgi:hypothetical protein
MNRFVALKDANEEEKKQFITSSWFQFDQRENLSSQIDVRGISDRRF